MASRIEDLVKSTEGLPPERLWEVYINGRLVMVGTADFINEKLGLHARYGLSPSGPYAQVVLMKPGGVTTTPVCLHPQEGVLIGAIGQKRPLVHPDDPDRLVATLPGGFKGGNESESGAAARELKEESGLVGEVIKAVGSHTHMDRALIMYSGKTYDEFFYVEVSDSLLKKGTAPGDLAPEVWKYEPELNPTPAKDEQILTKLEFVRADWLVQNAVDAYTFIGVMKTLLSLGRVQTK